MRSTVRPAARSATRQAPRHFVALARGTGLTAVLRGLRVFVSGGDTGTLTALVAMTDEGGSSGRLRGAMAVPPPGDVRNCVVAFSEEEGVCSRACSGTATVVLVANLVGE